MRQWADGESGAAPAGADPEKKALRASERQGEDVQRLRWAYVALLLCVSPERLVFIDEAGVRVDMTRTHGRAPKGLRIAEEVPRNRGRVTTVLGAMTYLGILTHMTVVGGTTGEVFERFVRERLVPALSPGQVIVWDNLGAHKQRVVREAVEAVGCTVVFLPPYSPEFNPIEEAWAKVKALLRKWAVRNASALPTAIRLALACIRPSDAEGYFRHAGYLARAG